MTPIFRWCLLAAVVASWWIAVVTAVSQRTAVPTGSADAARRYYRELATELGFRDPATILFSRLDDVPLYAGYAGISGDDLQRISPDTLMDPARLGLPCPNAQFESSACATGVFDPVAFRQATRNRPIQLGEILAARFFAPKIINIRQDPTIRQLGWRKLVRLKTRTGSRAAAKGVASIIVLFNYFTNPGELPFGVHADSVNTQVILVRNTPGAAAVYWLDYGPLLTGGRLSLQLDASFDAQDLQTSGNNAGIQPYFVPDGCVACHGKDPERSLLNYLDTDHWFDRLETDFQGVRDAGLPVLVDAGTNNPADDSFKRAFEVIKRFNLEVERQNGAAKPTSFHRAAVQTWLRLHTTNIEHVPPIARSVKSTLQWDSSIPKDKDSIEMLNQYCFRCHGSVDFNVFDKAMVFDPRRLGLVKARVDPTELQLQLNPGFVMPPDRLLDAGLRKRLIDLLTR